MMYFRAAILVASCFILANCSGAQAPANNNANASNTMAISVTQGTTRAEDAPFASVTICVPGTSTCQTIDNILVDTGSTGLRLLATSVTLSLPQVTLGGETLANCVQFADGSYGFGAVMQADIQLGGETARAQAIQMVHSSNLPTVPPSCKPSGVDNPTLIVDQATMGGNGILGIAVPLQDCGSACASSAVDGTYYTCSSSSSCIASAVSLNAQIQNPVAQFASSNTNGYIVSLPAVSAQGAASVNGTIIFGINTQSNNQLGSAKVITTDAGGMFASSFNGKSYPSFIDSGSNGLFVLSTAETGIPLCATASGFYCPPTTTTLAITQHGLNGVSSAVNLSIANAEQLFTNNPTFAAFSNLGGEFPGGIDFGLAYFFGQNIYFGLVGQQAGSVTGPFNAY
jgi:hypothetical protein